MIQVNVLYGHPTDTDAFEAYYAGKHMPLAEGALGPFTQAVYTSKCLPSPDGSKPAYYRVATLIFESMEKMQQAMGTPEGQAVGADLDNFATGGHTIVMGAIDEHAESMPSQVGASATA